MLVRKENRIKRVCKRRFESTLNNTQSVRVADVHIHNGQGDLTANKNGALLLEAITKVNATLLSYNHHEIDLYNKSAQVRLILKRDPDMDEYI